jgi:TetR/AcrR family transcriptional regulator of autoinduction and epiphytic fitness
MLNVSVPLVTSREAPEDGRHARSERTRAAIVEALLSLLDEGVLQPSAELLAERAGVSRRAVFHHFRDLDDLHATAAAKQMERVLPLLAPLPHGGPAAERIEAFVAQRCRFLALIAPVRRAALLVEPSSPVVAERLGAVRRQGRLAVEAVFSPELARVSPEERAEVTAALAAASSFSFWEALHTHQRLTPEEAARAMKRTLGALLSPWIKESKSPAKKP